MQSNDHQLLGFTCLAGVASCCALFFASFFGWSLSNSWPLVLLCAGFMVGLGSAMLADSKIPLFKPFYFWTDFWQGMPKWAQPLYFLVFVALLAQFAVMLLQPGPADPVLVDGQPLLNASGAAVMKLTSAQVTAQGEAMLRFFATIAAANYYQAAMYFFFRRGRA